MPKLVATQILTSNKAFPESLRDCASSKEVLSFNNLAAWVTLPSVVLWQHIHTKYVQVPKHVGRGVITRASLGDLRAYREFVSVQKVPSADHPLINSSLLASPTSNPKPSRL